MSPRKLFQDRRDAGQVLAPLLVSYRYRDPDSVVLALPRGGVPVAYEIARILDAPLDVCVVRKIGSPLQPELGVGAVAEDAVHVNPDVLRLSGLTKAQLDALVAEKRAEVEERVRKLRHGEPPLDVRRRTVIIVDDGIALGSTARAAVKTLRARGANRIVLAVPVAARHSLDELANEVDDIVCPHAEEDFFAVGLWYEDFTQVTDEEVIELLDRARSEREAAKSPRARSERVARARSAEVEISVGDEVVEGHLTIPPNARGLVLFAHGSGSSRLSPRNQYVASELHRAGLATLLLDLLTASEEREDARTSRLRFDVDLLASRVVAATDWIVHESEAKALPIGYFGASTGAAAALVAAARRPELVRAIVLRGGRPDLAESSLGDVKAPTLLVVGGADPEVLRLNRESLYLLACEKEIEVISEATHLFEEPGALERVAHAAVSWFSHHLVGDHAVGKRWRTHL